MLLFFILIIIAVLAWGWVGFPLLLAVWPKRKRTIAVPAAVREPSVSIVIAAYNEESVIGARLQNLVEIDLPGNTEILIGLDGCDDRTGAEIEEWAATAGLDHEQTRIVSQDDREERDVVNKKLGGPSDLPVHKFKDKERVFEPRRHGDTERAQDGNVQCSMFNVQCSTGNEEPRTKNQEPGTRNSERAQDGNVQCSTGNEEPRTKNQEPRLKLFDFPERRGKPAVLKDLVAAASGDVLVFSDANTMFAKDAVPKLLAPLADPDVGGACGRLVFLDQGGSTSENIYWKLETWLKTKESQIDSCLGANGAIYAIRRGYFWDELPGNTIVDDFVIGMKVRERGKRMVYVPDAVATEDLPETVAHEWHRRTRIGAGAYQALVLCRRCMLPTHGVFAFSFFSHKVLRWFTPHLLILLAGLSMAGWASTGGVWWNFFLAAQLLFYGLAIIGGYLKKNASRAARVPRICYYYTTMQCALMTGFFRWILRRQKTAWSRTERRIMKQ